MDSKKLISTILGIDNFKIHLFLLNNRRNHSKKFEFRRIKEGEEVQDRDCNFSNFDQNFGIDSRNNIKWNLISNPIVKNQFPQISFF